MSRIRPGMLTRGTAQEINQAVDRVGGLMNSGLAAGAARVGGVDGQFLNLTPPPGDWWFSELTSSGTGDPPAFSWQEVVEVSAGVWDIGTRTGVDNAYRVAKVGDNSGGANNGDLVLMRASLTVGGVFEFITTIARNSNLGDPCLIPLVDGYGTIIGVAGIAQRVVTADGTVECREYGFCDPACGRTEPIVPPPPPPPPPTNVIQVELLIAGGGTDIRDVTVTDGVTPVTQTTVEGRTAFLVPDGTYTVTLDDVFGGETVGWDLTVAVVDSGSGAVTDSFALSGGDVVLCQFSIVSPP